MAKLTVNEIKRQIAALEAKAARLAEEETKTAVSKVRALMNQLGVTLEHLSSTVGRKGAAVKKAIVGGKPKTPQRAGKGVVKYRDPHTGATWTGFGRAPGWIAGATDRDAFLVSNRGEHAPGARAGMPAAKKRAAAKGATAKKAAATKATAKKAKTNAAPAKKVSKAAVKRTAPNKAASKAVVPGTPKKSRTIKAAATKAAAKKAVSAGSGQAAPAPGSSQASAT